MKKRISDSHVSPRNSEKRDAKRERERERETAKHIRLGRVNINMSNRSFYSLITLGVLILLGAGILVVDAYASSNGVGHSYTELQPCGNGQILKIVNGVWSCGEDIDTNTVPIANCANGQVLKFAGGIWDCGTDDIGTATTSIAWSEITGVPSEFNDGDNVGYTGSGDLTVGGEYIIGTGTNLHIKATGQGKKLYLNPHADTGDVYVGAGGGIHHLIIDNGNLDVGGSVNLKGISVTIGVSCQNWGEINRCGTNRICACTNRGDGLKINLID
jgi:hypothetical protein